MKEEQSPGGEEAEQPDGVGAEPALEDQFRDVGVRVLVKDEIYGLVLIVAEVLHPVVAGLPGNCD